MIKCSCKSCGKRFTVPPSFAGRKGKCPDCKQIVLIPQMEPTPVAAVPGSNNAPQLSFDNNLAFSPTGAQVQETANDIDYRAPSAVDDARMLRQQKSETLYYDQPDGKRRFPWPIDIFLYPTSGAGLTQLAIFLGIPFLIGVFTMILGPFGIFIGIPGIVIMLIIYAYMAWYVCECIRDSGSGGVRAPDVIAASPQPWEVIGQLRRITACYLFFLAPTFVYYSFNQRFDTIFWVLAVSAVYFFPMGLLAVTMYDSLSGLNPILLIGSILRVFFSYGMMVAGLAVLILLIILFAISMKELGLGQIGIRCVSTYMLLVVAHVLGRFFYRKVDKLNWEV